jgi:hypothetical protein
VPRLGLRSVQPGVVRSGRAEKVPGQKKDRR